jgi:hypothetical protein
VSADVVAPRYDAGGLGSLLPAALAAVTGDRTHLPIPAGTRAVVVLVVDGLGRTLLDAHAALAPTLAAADGPTLDAPFPTTTATALTSIGTGRTPGEHGVVGFSFPAPTRDRRLVALTWSWDRMDAGPDARDDLPPEVLQPHATVLDRAGDHGVAATAVLRPEFVGSGLTRAALRGGHRRTATGLPATLDAAVGAATEVAGPAIVYAHHGDLDTIGHLDGPGTDRWCTELAAVDAAIATTVAGLPADVTLVVTADHGMVGIGSDGYVELADTPELLEGVTLLTGDARARQLVTRAGAEDGVAAAWREHAGDRAVVAHRDDAIAAGWFGPEVAPRVRAYLGDVLVAARSPDVAWVHRDVDPLGGRLVGHHGGLTRDEVAVPALVLPGGPS